MRRVEARHHGREFRCQRFELAAVALQILGQVGNLRLGLLQVGALPLAQLARVLNALFDPRDLGARLVEAALNRAQRVGLGRLIGANALDLRLGLAQIREHRLHRGLAARGGRIAHSRLGVQTLQAQRQQFGLQLALLFLECLIAPRRRGLALQVADLLFHLFAQIVQPIQILARVADAVLGFAAPLLVARNAGGLLQERAQIIGPRLDDARDHALLDDGVAARAQARCRGTAA